MIERHNLMMTSYIDLPPLAQNSIDALLSWHDSVKTMLDNSGAMALNNPWISSAIRDFKTNLETSTEVENSIPGNPWNSDFVSKFPDLVKTFNALPFTHIERILLLQNTKFCPSHNDQSKFLYSDNSIEPCNYRMTLRDSKSSKGFFVQPKPFSTWGTQHAFKKQGWPAMFWNAKPGWWWVLNNFCCQHGSDWKEGDDKVILSVQGTPDPVRHLELLKNSTHLRSLDHPNLAKFDNSSDQDKLAQLENAKKISLSHAVPEELQEMKNKLIEDNK